jgi:hypothetical protein
VPSVAFALESAGSAPPWSAHAGFSNDAAGFASCCGPATCSPPCRDFVAPLRRRTLTRRREPRYRGPWRLPGPDSHRLATVSLSLGYAIAPSPLFGVRAAGRTLRPEKPWRSLIGDSQGFGARRGDWC